MTDRNVRRYQDPDLDALLGISLEAFTPINESFEGILGPEVFPLVYPDWRASNQDYLRGLLTGDERHNVFVAESDDGAVVGFAAFSVRPDGKVGEITIDAVHPDFQGKGYGSALLNRVLDEMREKGVELVEVHTGGDASHAPARKAYERQGFVALPLVRYYKSLRD